jgi:hypothetical protein
MSTPTDPTTAELDARVIRDLRQNLERVESLEDGAAHGWSLRLTFGEIRALLRAVDERDDLKRRLLGEWEGDLPEPKPAAPVLYVCRRDADCTFGAHSTRCINENATTESTTDEPGPTCQRCNGRGGLPYDGPCSDCAGTGFLA